MTYRAYLFDRKPNGATSAGGATWHRVQHRGRRVTVAVVTEKRRRVFEAALHAAGHWSPRICRQRHALVTGELEGALRLAGWKP